MKEEIQQDNYFFVDESGDTVFQNKNGKWLVGRKNGSSPILMVGAIKTKQPEIVRKRIEELREEILKDESLKAIPSIKKTEKCFHAKDDCPIVRERVYRLLTELPFTCRIVVIKKTEELLEKMERNMEKLYDYILSELFQKVQDISQNDYLYIAKRGNRKRQEPLEKAVQHEVISQVPSVEPCLQVIDYCNWAVQRALLRKDKKYYELLKNKFEWVVELEQKEDKSFMARY